MNLYFLSFPLVGNPSEERFWTSQNDGIWEPVTNYRE